MKRPKRKDYSGLERLEYTKALESYADDLEYKLKNAIEWRDTYKNLGIIDKTTIAELKEFLEFAYQRGDLQHGNTCTLLREQRGDACSCGLVKALK